MSNEKAAKQVATDFETFVNELKDEFYKQLETTSALNVVASRLTNEKM